MEAFVSPYGLDGVIARYGDIRSYIEADGHLNPRWEAEKLTVIQIPFSLRLSWDVSVRITKIRCHKEIAAVLSAIFQAIYDRNLHGHLTSFGGCFAFRAKRTSPQRLSLHSFGCAVDLDPEWNAQGTAGNMNREIVKIFEDYGAFWGGRFSGRSRDPMHFQFAKGY